MPTALYFFLLLFNIKSKNKQDETNIKPKMSEGARKCVIKEKKWSDPKTDCRQLLKEFLK